MTSFLFLHPNDNICIEILLFAIITSFLLLHPNDNICIEILLLESKLASFSYVGGYVPSQEDARSARDFSFLCHSSHPLNLHLYSI